MFTNFLREIFILNLKVFFFEMLRSSIAEGFLPKYVVKRLNKTGINRHQKVNFYNDFHLPDLAVSFFDNKFLYDLLKQTDDHHGDHRVVGVKPIRL